MSPRSRTNQLLYQAELLVGLPVGDDEHSPARRMAIEESALALFELALGSLLKEELLIGSIPAYHTRGLSCHTVPF